MAIVSISRRKARRSFTLSHSSHALENEPQLRIHLVLGMTVGKGEHGNLTGNGTAFVSALILQKERFASSIAAFHDFRSSTVSNANQYTFLLFYALTLLNK